MLDVSCRALLGVFGAFGTDVVKPPGLPDTWDDIGLRPLPALGVGAIEMAPVQAVAATALSSIARDIRSCFIISPPVVPDTSKTAVAKHSVASAANLPLLL